MLDKSLPERDLEYNTSYQYHDFIKIIWRWFQKQAL